MQKLFIGLEGPIGIGKSHLTRKLAAKLGGLAMFEPVKTNPYLPYFYGKAEGVSMVEGMTRWTFPMQIHLLHARYILHQRARVSPQTVVQDRTIYGDTVFAKSHYDDEIMSELEWGTYQLAWEAMKQTLVYPDVMVFLDAPIEVLQRRIQEDRKRPEEEGIPDAYLGKLRNGYHTLRREVSGYTQVLSYDWIDPNSSFDELVRDIQMVTQDRGFTWARRRPTLLPPEDA